MKVAKLTDLRGLVYYDKDFEEWEPPTQEIGDPFFKVEYIEMTEAEFRSIVATNDSYEFFKQHKP